MNYKPNGITTDTPDEGKRILKKRLKAKKNGSLVVFGFLGSPTKMVRVHCRGGEGLVGF